ncbi:MAG: hypothetical protein OEZ02_14415, partial [Anaerolineae bacterium]|nr:hypothetical protein [Anaerolineae bacterium]
IAPNDARPLFHAGIALKESKNFTAAESMLRCAAEIAPKDLDIQRQLGAVVALTLVHPIPSISTTLEATADA